MNEDIYQRIEENPRFQELVQKRSRFAWLLSLITLVRIGSFWFDPGLREVTTVLPTHVALVVALAAVVLIWLGYWCRQDDWVMVGLFLTAGVMVTFGLLILTFCATMPPKMLI